MKDKMGSNREVLRRVWPSLEANAEKQKQYESWRLIFQPLFPFENYRFASYVVHSRAQ